MHAKRLFQRAGWYGFLAKFSRENYGVARSFAESFNGERFNVGSLEFLVTHEFILEAMSLSPIGELWFKGNNLIYVDFNPFLKDEHTYPEWQNGIPTQWLKEEW